MKIMRTLNLMVLALIAGTMISCSPSNDNRTKEDLFPKGKKLNSENFTGTVWLQMIENESDTALNIKMGNVTFEPGARTNWHYHPGGQILIVTKGKGLYQEKGKPVEVIKRGDVIKCPPSVNHWHGANPTDTMAHIAISLNTDKGGAVWLDKVSDEEYNSLNN